MNNRKTMAHFIPVYMYFGEEMSLLKWKAFKNRIDKKIRKNKEKYKVAVTGDKNKKNISLRKRLLFLVVIIWMIPVLIIYIFMSISYRNNIIDKTTILMEEGLKNFTSFNAQRIDELIDISKKISYEQVIEKAWKKYKNGTIEKGELHQEITSNLKSKYYVDNRFIISVFYLSEDPERIYYTSRKDMNYINLYKNEVAEEAHKITEQETSDAHIRIINGKIYIIRNLYTTSNYTKFGTLILELNQNKLLDGISFNNNYELGFFINDTNSMISFDKNLFEKNRTDIINKLKVRYSVNENRGMIYEKDTTYTGMIYQQKYADYHIGAILVASQNEIYSELYDFYSIMIFTMLIIIPVFIYMIYFIAHHISKPMSRMISAVKEVEEGGFGKQILGESMPNSEFSVLLESFNHMSSEIKYLFDYAYSEKIARKNAKIMALQSQINPHFLNNTLEMMNWQARMAGDVTVSKMIEALGTLLNYTMDRSNKKTISLAEELGCVDAYFYIISMRFGKRLTIEKDVDEKLLQVKVPQLILQPLIENAVVHGVEKVKSGKIQIKIYKEKFYKGEKREVVVLQIINTGKNMSKEEITKIKELLDFNNKQDSGNKINHESLGIQNVNERIKLIYGEEYGLTIKPMKEGETASTIIIPEIPRGYN